MLFVSGTPIVISGITAAIGQDSLNGRERCVHCNDIIVAIDIIAAE